MESTGTLFGTSLGGEVARESSGSMTADAFVAELRGGQEGSAKSRVLGAQSSHPVAIRLSAALRKVCAGAGSSPLYEGSPDRGVG